MDLQNTVIQIDIPGDTPLYVDLADIYQLEKRKVEVATVTKSTAGSLLRALEDGFAQTGNLLAMVSHKSTAIELLIKRREAYLTIEVIPSTLQQKGLATARSPSGSEDLRKSVMALDVELQNLENIQAQVQALKELLKIKVQGFQMSFTATKRVIDQSGMEFNSSFAQSAPTTPKY